MKTGAGGPPATELTLTLSSVAAPLSLLHLQVHILSLYLFLSLSHCVYLFLSLTLWLSHCLSLSAFDSVTLEAAVHIDKLEH